MNRVWKGVGRAGWLLILWVGLSANALGRSLEDIQRSGVLRVCVAGSSAEFYRQNAEALAQHLGLNAEVLNLKAWDDQFRNAEGTVARDAAYTPQVFASGQCDILPNDLHVLPWRASKMTLVPLYNTRKVVVAHRNLRSRLRAVSDLQGLTAAVQAGTSYDSWLQQQNEGPWQQSPVQLIHRPTADVMKAVATQEADFTVIGSEGAFKGVRGDLDALDILFSVDEEPVVVAWGVPSDAPALAQRVAVFFEDQRRVGSVLDRNWRRHYDISFMEYQLFDAGFSQRSVPWQAALPWVLPGFGVLLLWLGVIGRSNRRLAREVQRREQMQSDVQRLLAQKSAMVDLARRLQEAASLDLLGREFLQAAREVLGAQQGVIYVADAEPERPLRLLCSAGAAQEPSSTLMPGEGVLGQCLLDRAVRYMNAPDDGAWMLRSGLGSTLPACVILAPLLWQKQVIGALELALMHAPDSTQREQVENMVTLLSVNLEILRRTQQTADLLSDTARAAAHASSELEYLQALIDTFPFAMYYKGRDTRYQGLNRAYERFYGVHREDVVGRRIDELDFLPEPVRKACQQEDEMLVAQRHTVRRRIRVQAADGQWHERLFSASGFSTANGRDGGVVGTIVDVNLFASRDGPEPVQEPESRT